MKPKMSPIEREGSIENTTNNPKTKKLLDILIEILRQVIQDPISDIDLKEACNLCQICRSLAVDIQYEIFSTYACYALRDDQDKSASIAWEGKGDRSTAV